MSDTSLSRRGFLKAAGALVVAINLPAVRPLPVSAAALGPGPALVPADELDSWVAIAKDGSVTIFTGKVELGTGLATATKQIAADELDIPLDSITLVQADTWHTVDQGYTAGSQSLKTQWASGLRVAAASARAHLLQLASQRLGVPVAQLRVESGVVSALSDAGKKVAYQDLLGGVSFGAKVDSKAKPKAVGDYKVIGRPVPREDIPGKVTGEFQYVQDVKLPGMLHGRVVRPQRGAPSQPGPYAFVPSAMLTNGKVVYVDDSSVSKLPGSPQAVRIHDFVGVVAEREEQAITAAQALRVEWAQDVDLPAQQDLYEAIRTAKIDTTRVLADSGGLDQALAGAERRFEATYHHPFQMHGSIGPSCAVADVSGGQATVYSATQGVYQLRGALATLLAMPEQNVHVVYVEGSGCYGLNGADNVALDAALLSKAAGRPVRVQYMRSDEMGWENYGNAMVMSLKAGVDASGKIVAWDQENWTVSRGNRPGPPGNLPTGMLAGFPEPPPAKSPPPTPPLGNDGLNSLPSYNGFGSVRVRSYTVNKPWLFTGPLRSPSRLQNTFANESFMDEIAAALKADPVEFRLRHTTDPRLVEAIKRAATSFGWDARPSPNPQQGSGPTQTGRGISSVFYEGRDAYVVVIASVAVDRASNAVSLKKVVVAHDNGTVVNPDGLRNQVEGNVIQASGRALKEEVKFDTSGPLTLDWSSYPILTFSEIPDQVTVEIIDRPGVPATGAGEPTSTAVAGAIANAIFDATGLRLREIPFTPARIAAARQQQA